MTAQYYQDLNSAPIRATIVSSTKMSEPDANAECRRAELLDVMERSAKTHHHAEEEQTKVDALERWKAAFVEFARLKTKAAAASTSSEQ